MKKFFIKYKTIFIGFGLASLTTLITYLIFGLIRKDNYMWGVIQFTITLGFFALAWFTGGLVNHNIRRNENNKFADTSYKNPKKAEYKTFLSSCYYACLFGAIFNLIGYYAFDMGKYISETILIFF